MPTPYWLKHLCSIRAWVPVSFFLSLSLSLSLSLFLADSLEREGWLSNPGNISLLPSFISHPWLRTTRFPSIKGPTDTDSLKITCGCVTIWVYLSAIARLNLMVLAPYKIFSICFIWQYQEKFHLLNDCLLILYSIFLWNIIMPHI